MHKIAIALIVTVSLLAGAAAAAPASAVVVGGGGGCPDGLTAVSVALGTSPDRNGDGYVCVGSAGASGRSLTIDNTALPCPPLGGNCDP